MPPLIGPPPGSTPASLAGTRRGRRVLPDDILREASRRLGIVSLTAAALWTLGTGLYRLALWIQSGRDPAVLRYDSSDTISIVMVLASLGLYAYSRRPDQGPRFVLDLGLVYLVLTGLALGLSWHSPRLPPGTPVAPTITWVGPVILMFAAMVPSTPGKMLVAGFLAASMNPLGMLLARARGTWAFEPAGAVFLMHYPDYLMAGVAVVISHAVTRMGEEVSRARELGSYRLGELLGKGGMGEVYRASHRMLARPAAIKLIRPEVLSAADRSSAALAIARFRREAEAAAQLRSPHTVQLYDFGVTADQTLYLVMELLDGMDLETLVRQNGALPASRVIAILRQVCDSLEEAHASGLVHRDIKPANIHIGRQGRRHDVVKVLDFGLAKCMECVAEESPVQSLATATGLTPGTPAYMAPEVAAGERYDARADLYAVGCVGYFLLTEQLLFEAENSLQMIARQIRDTPVPPSQRTELPIPPALERLILRCLAKAPAERPGSAAELSGALAEIPTEPWGEEEAGHWWTTHAPRPGLVAPDAAGPAA